MLRREDADRLLTNEIAPGYVRPAYDGHSFANVPATIGSLLGVDLGLGGPPLSTAVFEGARDVETVVVVLVDGFGFEQWERHHTDHEFFARLTDRTPVTPLTSVYPSETAAAMSTYMTGRTPVEHGLIGWNVYLKDQNTVIESLPFQTKGEEDAGEALGIDNDILRDGTPIVEQLSREGIETRRVVPESIVDDSGTRSFKQAPYDNLDAFASRLREAIQATDSGFVHAYLPHIDTAAHEVGTAAPDYRSELEAVADSLERSIAGVDDETAERTLLIVTADHGHVDTTPGENLDLLQCDVVENAVGTDARGTPLFGGGPRNVHLYTEDPERVRDDLASELVGSALVLLCEEALSEGLFGPGDPSETFYRQCGDVLVIPRDRSMWHSEEHEELEHIGMHGGLHPDEQLVPFTAIRLDELRD